MSYLIQQILFCLIIAAILGFIIGWLLRGISAKQRELNLTAECDKRIRGLKILPASEIEKQRVAAIKTTIADTGNTNVVSTESTTPTNNTIADVANTVSADSKIDQVSLNEHDIEQIEGIGQGRGNVLRGLGIATIQELLDKYSKANGSRGVLASKLEIDEDVVRQWVSMADLMRIPGIGSQYSELLEASSVHSVPELAEQDALNLTETMLLINKAQHITVLTLPGTSEVSSWITIAKSLPSKITL